MEYNHSIWATIIPSLLLVLFIYLRDKLRREPIGVLLFTYFIGICGGLVLVFLYHGMHIPTIYDAPDILSWNTIWKMAIGAGLDQLIMLAILLCFIRYNIFVDEHTDKIVYASCIAMGVITAKNVVYCLMNNSATMYSQGVVRSLVLIPIFFVCGVMLGYLCSSLKIKKIPFYSLKFPILIVVPISLQCILSYIFLFFDVQFGLTGSFFYFLVVLVVGLYMYILHDNAIEKSQIRDIEEKIVKSVYDITRYIKKK